MGFVIFMAIGVYLLISFGVVIWAATRAKDGKGAVRRGLLAALVMFLIPCWDWIPTVVAHKYYCEKEAGFWVYKTLDQWKVENPGVMEGLVANKVSIQRVGDEDNYTDTQTLNQRFTWLNERHRPIFLLPVHAWKREIVDDKSGEILARHIDFSSGAGRDQLKFWMNIQGCPNGTKNRNALFSFADDLIKMTDTTQRNIK